MYNRLSAEFNFLRQTTFYHEYLQKFKTILNRSESTGSVGYLTSSNQTKKSSIFM